jgi:hypothetical protein
MAKSEKYRAVANPAYAAGMREIRRSNAAGTHDARPSRERSRRDAKRAAIRRDMD